MNTRSVAHKFCEWMIENGYCDEEDLEDVMDEIIEDFEKMHNTIPRMFNLLSDISYS